MPQSAKEQVDITALIQGILNGYPGNSAIFREYIQNSDDAKATKQVRSSVAAGPCANLYHRSSFWMKGLMGLIPFWIQTFVALKDLP